MDIKDSYLHGTVGVVKSISVNADKLTYTLADIAGTVKEVTLPVATTSANGLMSSGDKTKLDNLSSTIGNYVTLNTDQEITGTKTFTKQQKFTVAKGTAPFQVTSDTKVTNLNADKLDGYKSREFVKQITGTYESTTELLQAVNQYIGNHLVSIKSNSWGKLLNLSGQDWGTGLIYSQNIFNNTSSTLGGGIWFNQHGTQAYLLKLSGNTSDNSITADRFITNSMLDSITVFSASTADKLKTKRKLWGQDFDGTSDVNGNMTDVGTVNKIFKVVGGTNNALLNVTSVSANIDYLHMYVSSNITSNINSRPLVLQNGYGNVGIGVTQPTQKLEVEGNIKATSFIGNLDGTYVNKLTGYSKATSASNIAATDTLNAALGKLEYKADYAYDWVIGVTAMDTDEYINKWSEIVGFLDSVKEGTDITDEFVTRKTNQTITGVKTFNGGVTLSCGLNINGINPITWNDRTYHQRIQTTDDMITNNKLFEFQQSKDAGVTWESLFIIKDNGNVEASKFITKNGTSSQFVKGDGSLDSTTYLTQHQSLANYVTLNTTQTITGNKTFQLSGTEFILNNTKSNPVIQVNTEGSWARALDFINTNNSEVNVKASFGAYGTKDIIHYAYIALKDQDYSSATFQFSPTHLTINSNSNTRGVPLILRNKGWETNMSTALDFYNGRMYAGPNARIETKMVGGGNAGGTLIFYTQTRHAETNPNPNGLTERLRIGDNGIIQTSGDIQLYSTSGDSKSLIFQRGDTTDDLVDWKMYVTGGIFKLQNRSNKDTWNDVINFSAESSKSISTTYSITASKFIVPSGTSSQFLKADGSIDNTAYLTELPTHDHSSIKVIACNKTTNSKAWDDATITSPKTVKFWDVYEDGGPTTYGNILEINGIDNHWKPQLWFDSGSGQMRVRNRTYGATVTTWNDWRTILDSVNYTTYTVKKDGTGATGTWNINISGSANAVDGYSSESFESYYKTIIDASGLDENTWYPVIMNIGTSLQTRIRIEGKSTANASWNNRLSDRNFAVILDYTVNGSYWGWSKVERVVHKYQEGAGANKCLRGLDQLTNSSTEYVYVRGGAIYNFYLSRFIVPELKTTEYTVSSQSVAPTQTEPALITRNDAWISDIPTKVSQLINDSGFLTSRGYIGTTAVQVSSANQHLTGIVDLTMSGTLKVNCITSNNDSLQLKYQGDNTKSIILNDTAFKPFDDATGKLALGSTSARWSTIYGVSGNFTKSITSSLTTASHLAGNQGVAIINSTASGSNNYTMLAKMNSTNGVFCQGVYRGSYDFYYTVKTTIDEKTNSVTKTLTLLDESGNSYFPGDITALGFKKSKSSDSYVLLGGGGHKSLSSLTASKLNSTTIIDAKTLNLSNVSWIDTGYTFANLDSGTYAVQVTSGSNLIASGIMSVYKNLEDTTGDEIPLHVYHKPSSGNSWRPYLRTYANKLQISSNDTTVTSRTVTIKIAQIL